MSDEQAKINYQLAERIKSLEQWRDSIIQACFQAPKSAEAKPIPKAEYKMSIGEIAEKFPEDLRQHLTITADTIKTEFVSRDKWLKMDEIAKSLGYKYVSAGKDSHWAVSK